MWEYAGGYDVFSRRSVLAPLKICMYLRMDLSLPEGMLDLSQPVPGLSPMDAPGGLPGVGARFLTRQNPVPGQAAPIFRADRQWLSRQMMERSLAPTRFFDESHDIRQEVAEANEYLVRRPIARRATWAAAAPDPSEGPPIVAPPPPPAAAPAAPPPAPAGMAPGMDEAAFNRQMGLRFGGMPAASTRLFFE